MKFILSILAAITARAGAIAAPFAIQEIGALSQFAAAAIGIYFDSTLTAEEKAKLWETAKADFTSLIEALKDEGAIIADDIPAIIMAAGGDQIGSLFS